MNHLIPGPALILGTFSPVVVLLNSQLKPEINLLLSFMHIEVIVTAVQAICLSVLVLFLNIYLLF